MKQGEPMRLLLDHDGITRARGHIHLTVASDGRMDTVSGQYVNSYGRVTVNHNGPRTQGMRKHGDEHNRIERGMHDWTATTQ